MGSHHRISRNEVAGIRASARAEALLIRQFRYWMNGHATSEFKFVNLAWAALTGTIDAHSAKLIFGEIHVFTRVVHDRAVRQIEWLPDLGRCISRDEGLVLALVQASQHNEPYAELAAASELLGTFEVEALVHASRSLARVLATKNLLLVPVEPVPDLTAADLGLARRQLH